MTSIVILLTMVQSSFALVSTPPQRPQTFLNTTYSPNTGATINVPAGGNLQTAINNAQLGDTITLAAGASFTGNFTLPNKTTGSGWIIIRTSAPDSALPPPGNRITTSHVSQMAKIVAPNGAPAMATQNNAHHYRFVGIEFTVASNIVTNTGIVVFGGASQTSAQTPNNLILDRCYIHGTATQQIQNGLRLNSASTAVIDSRFDKCQATSFESHCIGGYNGPGPFKIVNNHLADATIPVLFGGAVPSVSGLIPSDIEFMNNYVTRPLSWWPNHSSYAGTAWYVKNLFELKNARRVLFEGNILEHNWPHTGSTPDGSPQHGFAILLTVRGEGGSASWATVSDVLIRRNIIRKSNVGISLSGTEGTGTHRIAIEGNLFEDIGLNWGNNDRSGLWMQVNTVDDLIVNHNTCINDGDILFANGSEVGDLDYINNISNHNAARTINNNRGINSTGGFAVGTATLNAKFVNYDVMKNVMANAAGFTSNYPAGNFFPANFGAVGFENLAGGNYRLASSSAYNNAGTDGKDIGADIDVIATATAGTISGVWQTPPTSGSAYQQESSGQVSMEAEIHDGTTSRGGKNWTEVSNTSYSGGKALQVLPNTGSQINSNPQTTAAQVDYKINFNRTGTHYVWVRGFSATSADDSIHVGFDGALIASNLTSFSSTGKWSKTISGGTVVAINVPSTGVHTLNIWMREDGMVVDKIVLTTSSSFIPTGTGPAMSPRSGGSNTPPTIGSLSVSPSSVPQGQSLTLTANSVADANGNLEQVIFYRDSNTSGTWDSGDVQIGSDSNSSGGFTLNFSTSGLTLGTHRFFARAKDTAGAFSSAVTNTATVTTPSTTGVFQQAADGTVSIEVENFHTNTAQGGKNWSVISNGSFSGGSGMQALPNSGTVTTTNITTNSPRLNYDINFTQTGTYYLWLRGSAASGADDSVHAGLDGAVVANNMVGFGTSPTWTKKISGGTVVPFNVSTTGVHTINIWMREDGLLLDKLVLTKSTSFTPTGTGPAQSPKN